MSKEIIFPTIYKRSSTGAIQTWQIKVKDRSYFVTEGILNGKLTETAAHECFAKNEGKANETSGNQQAIKEAEALITKKLKKGYMKDLASVDKTTFLKPMKGDKYIDRRDEIVWPVDCQDKLNGIRCQITKDGAKSTGGETFYTIPHILEALKPIFDKNPGGFIDGELYNYEHRRNLNRLIKLVSVVIKPKDLTPQLLEDSKNIVELHVFDGFGFGYVLPTDRYEDRHQRLQDLIEAYAPKHVKNVKSTSVQDEETLFKMLAENKKDGGEGLMVRHSECFYKNGRSKFLLKLKHFCDEEFEILDLQEGNSDWRGCVKRVILKLNKPGTDKDGNIVTQFAANIDGDREWLRELYKNKEKVIGLMGNVEFQHYSEFGICQLAWLRNIRCYE